MPEDDTEMQKRKLAAAQLTSGQYKTIFFLEIIVFLRQGNLEANGFGSRALAQGTISRLHDKLEVEAFR